MSTKRLYFLPVKLSDLQWNANRAEDRDIRASYLGIMEQGFSDSDNELWYTIWEIRRKSDNNLVGVFRFFGPPNEKYETALDFYIENEYTGRGYGSEAFRHIIDYLFSFKSCSYIKCFLEKNDRNSSRFVKRFGFIKRHDEEEKETYELEKARRHTTLPLMITGVSLTAAFKLFFSTMHPLMWAVAPAMFAIGLVTDYLDAKRRKDS